MVSYRSHRHIKKKTKSKQKSKIDSLVYLAVIIGPLLTLPQVYSIWVEGQRGVSIISWLAYLLASIIWLIYGIKHNDKPMLIVEIIWILLDILVIIGVARLH
ncbi:MAG: hypothetical protein WCK26_01340 [Candidatus Saccharibacteria bacterium]